MMKSRGRIGVIGTIVLLIALTLGTARADIDYWPVLEWSEENQTIMYPAYSKEGKFVMVFPFYFRTNEGKDNHLFWPMLKTSSGKISRVAPFWFNGENNFVMFPFLWRSPDFTLWTIPPVYIDNSDNFMAAIPFFIKSDEKLFIFPNYLRTDNEKTHSTKVFPFYYNGLEKEGDMRSTLWMMPYHQITGKGGSHRYRALYPFFSYENDLGSKQGHLQIFNYLRTKDKDEVTDMFIPLFAHTKSDKYTSFWAANSYYKESETCFQITSFPFFEINSDTEKKTRSFKSFVFEREIAPEKTKTLVPFFYHCENLYDKDKGEKNSTDWRVFICAGYHRDLEYKRRLLFPFFYQRQDKYGDNNLWCFPVHRRWNKDAEKSYFALYPFICSKSEGEQNFLWTMNYYHSKSENKDSLAVFPFYGEKSVKLGNGELEKSMWIGWPFYSRKKVEDKTGKLLERNNRFLVFSNNVARTGKRTLKLFDWVIREQVN